MPPVGHSVVREMRHSWLLSSVQFAGGSACGRPSKAITAFGAPGTWLRAHDSLQVQQEGLAMPL